MNKIKKKTEQRRLSAAVSRGSPRKIEVSKQQKDKRLGEGLVGDSLGHLLVDDDELEDGQGVEDGDDEQVPYVELRLFGVEARPFARQVGHEQERLGAHHVLVAERVRQQVDVADVQQRRRPRPQRRRRRRRRQARRRRRHAHDRCTSRTLLADRNNVTRIEICERYFTLKSSPIKWLESIFAVKLGTEKNINYETDHPRYNLPLSHFLLKQESKEKSLPRDSESIGFDSRTR